MELKNMSKNAFSINQLAFCLKETPFTVTSKIAQSISEVISDEHY